MRSFFRPLFRLVALVSLSGLMPACSILFDGSGYRSGSGTDAGPVVTDAPPIACSDSSMCTAVGTYCGPAGTCVPGCDDDLDCTGPDEFCDTSAHVCVTSDPCLRDADCAGNEYCDTGDGFCYLCDSDGDRWADDDAPVSCSIRPAANTIGGGDCEPDDPSAHPFAPPDCDLGTDDTCGTGVGAFSDEVFEIGLVGLVEMPATPAGETLHVVPLSSSPSSVRLLIVYRDADDLPTIAIGEFADGSMPTVATPTPLPGWAPTDTIISSRLAVLRDPDGGAYIGSVEVLDNGTGDPFYASEYAAHVGTDGALAPADGSSLRRTLAIAGTPQSVGAVIASFDTTIGAGTNAFLAAVLKVESGGITADTLFLLGMNTGHFEAPATFVPGTGGYGGGSSGTAGAAFHADASRSTMTWWNGGVGGRERFAGYDALSTYRSGVASGTDGGMNIGLSTAPMGGASLATYTVRCMPTGCSFSSPTTLMAAAALGGAGGLDPLLAADHMGGSSFMVVGRSGMGVGGLSATAMDLRTDPPTARSLLLPVGELNSAIDIDIGIGLAVASASTGALTIGFGMSTPTNVRYGAVRVCASFTP